MFILKPETAMGRLNQQELEIQWVYMCTIYIQPMFAWLGGCPWETWEEQVPSSGDGNTSWFSGDVLETWNHH